MNGCRPASARAGRRGHARGVSLLELVVTIAIVAFAVTGVVGALSGNAVQSANRMVRQQAAAIASAYLEEIVQRPVTDPDGGTEPTRDQFDNVDDYNGLPDSDVRDQQGVEILELADYAVLVQVGAGTLPGPTPVPARLINVTVTHPSGITVLLTGYRTDHP
jgi:MSHA pilin protein MshD